MGNQVHPPRFVVQFLRWFCEPRLLPEIEGDLYELFQRWVKQYGCSAARWRYGLHVLSFFRPYYFKKKTHTFHDYSSNPMDIISNYLKVARRNLLRHKVFSVINIAGLSLGLACCMLIVLYAKDEWSFDRFHEHKDQLYRVTATISGERGINQVGSTNQIVGPSFTAEIPEVEAFVRMQSASFIVRHETQTFNQEVVFVDNNFFSLFSWPLIAGDPDKVLSEMNAMVLSEAAALKYFGTTDVLGKTLEFEAGDTFESFVVSGIAKNPPQNSSIQFEVLLPFSYNLKLYTDNAWVGFYMNTFLLLHPDADPQVVEDKMNQVFLSKAGDELREARERLDFKAQVHFGLQPLLQIHLDTAYADVRNGLTGSSNPVYSYLLSGIALFVLVIACINFINLTIAHSLKRGKEIGIRKVMGGQRQQLMKQFLGESFVLSMLAFGAALLIVQSVLPFFNELVNKRLEFSYLLDLRLIVTYSMLLLLTGLIAGFYPALVLSGFNPVRALYNRQRLTGKHYFAKSLVILQFALATFLIIGTLGIYAQFDYLTDKDLGYNDEHLMIVHLGRRQQDATINALKQALDKEPSIELMASKDFGQNYTLAKVNQQTKEIYFAISWIDEHFLSALQIPILQGRNFSPDYPMDATQSVIVNGTFAREAGWDDPIGQVIDYANERLTVVGVVRDYHFTSLKEKIGPLLFKKGAGDLWVKVKPDQIPQALKAIQTAYRQLVPYRPLDYEFMDAINARNYESEARWKQMITLGALLSIMVSCMGMFGLAMLSIQQRAKEVGIRKVLGAAVSHVVFLLSIDFLKLVLIAFLLAIPLANYAVGRWLETFAYRIEVGWWLFAGAGLLALCIALITISLQTVKAALANPVDSLRDE